MAAGSFEAAYLDLLHSGELKARAAEFYGRLSKCCVCPWNCRVDRLGGEVGFCCTGELGRVSSYGPHMGEEPPLTGWRGSGTIFFSRCNLHCQFCQNHDISQRDAGDEVTPEELASIMLELQHVGCHNINFVSPSHVVPQILVAVLIAAEAGLRLPLVYNTGGYDSMWTLKTLDGVVDIYMPDMKYASAEIAHRYSPCARCFAKSATCKSTIWAWPHVGCWCAICSSRTIWLAPNRLSSFLLPRSRPTPIST